MSAGFACVIALLVVLAGVGISRIDAVLRNEELILHDRYANIAIGHGIENDVNRQARALQTALIATDIEIVKSEVARDTARGAVSAPFSRVSTSSPPVS